VKVVRAIPGGRPDRYNKFSRRQPRLKSPGDWAPELKVHVVPENRHVAFWGQRYSREGAGVVVAFEHSQARFHGSGVQEAGKLAEPATQVRHHAASAKFPSFREPLRAGGAPKLLPEAEHFLGRDFNAIEKSTSGPQVLDLAGRQWEFRLRILGPEGRSFLGRNGLGTERTRAGMELHVRTPVPPPTEDHENPRFQEEAECLLPSWQRVFRLMESVHLRSRRWSYRIRILVGQFFRCPGRIDKILPSWFRFVESPEPSVH
jgi:hypothetical protein